MGRSWRLLRPGRASRDIRSVGHEDPEPAPPPLGHLPVLLARPAMVCAHLLAARVLELRADDDALVGRQVPDVPPQPAELVARDRHPLGVGELIGQLDTVLTRAERHRALDRGRDRAAAGDRSPAVLHPRQKALLESIRDVGATGKRTTSPGEHDQLQAGLRVAVLEVLSAKAMAVHAQQHLPLGPRHGGDGLRRVARERVRAIAPRQRSGAPRFRVSFGSGRHI